MDTDKTSLGLDESNAQNYHGLAKVLRPDPCPSLGLTIWQILIKSGL